MNAERLHRILIDLNSDLKQSKTSNLLQQVRDHLQNQVNQPNQPNHQNNLVNSLEKLNEALESSSYKDYSPSWKEIIEDISGEINFGIDLKNQIQTIISNNSITPAKALEDIKGIVDNMQNFETALNNTLSGFKTFGIEKEDLEEGQCELGYTIPREFVKNNLTDLEKEIWELNFILKHLSEAVTGKKEEYKVKTISSSDFLLYILIGLTVGNVLSKATERILNIYKNILEIKVLRNQLKEKGIPAEDTEPIEIRANGMMKTEVNAIANEIIEENYTGKEARKNELENSLVIALNKLANRIDKGFDVEIRVKPLPEPAEDEEPNEEYQSQAELINSIKESSRNIEYIETGGESILELPEKTDEEE